MGQQNLLQAFASDQQRPSINEEPDTTTLHFSTTHSLPKRRYTGVLSPTWLPAFWSKPLIGYSAAIALPVLTACCSWILAFFFPTFNVRGLFLIFSALLVAYLWGTGPGLLSSLVQAILANLVHSFPTIVWNTSPQGITQILSYLLVVGVLCLLISRLEYTNQEAQRVRQVAEETARQWQEEKRLAAQQTSALQAIFTAIVDEIYVYNSAGQLLQVNSTGQQFNPYTDKEDYLARPFSDRFTEFLVRDESGHPLSLENIPASRVLRGETLTGDQAVDILLRNTDGQDQLFNVTGAPISNAAGQIQGGVVVMRNVTRRKELERENSTRARQLSTLIDTVPDAITVFDLQGNIIQSNESAKNLSLRAALDLHQPVLQRVELLRPHRTSGTLLDKHAVPIMRILQGETITGAESQDICVNTFDGEEIWLNVTGAPLYDDQNQLVGGVTVTRDRTQQRKIEQRTRETLEALLAFAEELVETGKTEWVAEKSGQTNQAGVDMVAQRLTTLIGQMLNYQQVSMTLFQAGSNELQSTAIYGMEPEQERAWRSRQAGFTISELLKGTAFEQRLLAGEAVVLDLNQPPFAEQLTFYTRRRLLIIPMALENRSIGILTFVATDHAAEYTDEEIGLARALAELATLTLERQRLLLERIKDQTTMLALSEMNRLMDEFIGIAGHELRTPLTSIKGNVQLAMRQVKKLLKDQESLPPEVGQSLLAIQRNLDRTERQIGMQNRLVSDLLDVARIHSSRLELYPDLFDLALLVRECVEDQQYLTPTRDIRLHLPDSEELLIRADSDRVRQVISNYLSNALKYSEAEKPVEVYLERDNNVVRVSVHDCGPGLQPEHLSKIWERFYRVPHIEVKSGSGIGLGLGLHICRMIIERQDGQVGVQSTPGEGSTFWFTLPLAEAMV